MDIDECYRELEGNSFVLGRLITLRLCLGLAALYMGFAFVIWANAAGKAPFPPEAKTAPRKPYRE